MGLRIFSKISNGIHRHIYFQKYVMEPIAIYVYIYIWRWIPLLIF